MDFPQFKEEKMKLISDVYLAIMNKLNSCIDIELSVILQVYRVVHYIMYAAYNTNYFMYFPAVHSLAKVTYFCAESWKDMEDWMECIKESSRISVSHFNIF